MTVDHDHHRARRQPMERFFSKQGIARIEPHLVYLIRILVSRFQELRGTGTVVRLDHVFAALAGDVIMGVCIENPPEPYLLHPTFNPDWHNLFRTLIKSMPIFMNFPWIIRYVLTFI